MDEFTEVESWRKKLNEGKKNLAGKPMASFKDKVDYPKLIQSAHQALSSMGADIPESFPMFEKNKAFKEYYDKVLFDHMQNFAPDGFYFGEHPNNPKEFGYWEMESPR